MWITQTSLSLLLPMDALPSDILKRVIFSYFLPSTTSPAFPKQKTLGPPPLTAALPQEPPARLCLAALLPPSPFSPARILLCTDLVLRDHLAGGLKTISAWVPPRAPHKITGVGWRLTF